MNEISDRRIESWQDSLSFLRYNQIAHSSFKGPSREQLSTGISSLQKATY